MFNPSSACFWPIVASILWAKGGGDPPPMAEVQEATATARWEMFQTAQDADGALGEAPQLLSTAEGNLRVFTHDVLYPHHDKDVRSLSPFPISLLQDVELVVWLLDYWGQMRSIIISPASGLVKTRAYVLVHRMHARALSPVDHTGTPHDDLLAAGVGLSWEKW